MISPIRMNRRLVLTVILLPIIVLPACDKPQPLGDANAIIVGASNEAWAEVEDEVQEALAPRTFTVRDEQIFRVTQVDPTSQPWKDLRRFRQILLIGEPSDPWIAEALEKAPSPLPDLPAVVQARNVWAQNQQVTIALSPPAAAASAVTPLLEQVGNEYLGQFQRYVEQRMFASGADSALADSLRAAAGFSILLPAVYYGKQVEPNVYLFRNDYPDPSQLIRSVLVAWRPSEAAEVSAAEALRWRGEIAGRVYEPAQVRDTAETIVRELTESGTPAVQVQGVWGNPPGEWPAAGPFLTRLIACPSQGREYLLDAWLYAPGKEKYEYMLQLNTILDSFTCASGRTAR
jgi:hypothetical protein